MLGSRDDERVELECPECGTVFETTSRTVEKGTARCPRGHEFAVMGMLGGAGGDEPGRG